ncbi:MULTISPECIES: TetR/AcrR family transcriptional regulator [unclassified Gordonia (in: high G+C Gram-positive bacteria)]|uniref:TetR/AcrR family transcriptional regulator n=1 Tax=unclassified Gordonia (in: high G+C Gram-positive bacteria) TaxID=2657482 RepID=UPI001F0D994E|nr:TetR family transcriptional regulator [Gordonia sp. ABSL49_1]MCH5645258.1 TetR family transcriptional regulator [Gordonia sp. ABSL49_1]
MSTRSGAAARRTLIADSAIEIIARDGVRALTHRAVDREAGIPQGSTSYHARTRRALLEVVVGALAERTLADATRLASFLDARFEDSQEVSVEELARALGDLVDSLTSRHSDMKARLALILEVDDDALRGQLLGDSEVQSVGRRVVVSALAARGQTVDDAQADEVVSLLDALVFQRTIVGGGTSVEAIIATYLKGLL